MKADKLLEKLTEAEKQYQVWSPSEEANEPNVHRSTFDGEGIRNQALYYFMDNVKAFYDFVVSLPTNLFDDLKVAYDKAVEEIDFKIEDSMDVLIELSADKERLVTRHRHITTQTIVNFLKQLDDATIIDFLKSQDDTQVEEV